MSKNIIIKENMTKTLVKTKRMLYTINKILSDEKSLVDNSDAWIQVLLDWKTTNIMQERTSFPDNKDGLLSLRELNLRWNRLKFIPRQIYNLRELRILALNNNNLVQVPSGISNLENLVELNFNINNLSSLPDDIIKLKKLRIVNIKNNKNLELTKLQIAWLNSLLLNGCTVIYDKYKFNLGE